jgi:2-dehydro-3-deoxygalactonokinase
MRKHLLTLDSGTTNTRAVLWDAAAKIVDIEKVEVGVRNTAIDGNNSRLKTGVNACMEKLLRRNGLDFDGVAAIYASGMITSNVGLYELPHLVAPAGRDDFVQGVVMVDLPDVAPKPIHFIPGLKNMAGGVTIENVEGQDIMRGEEAESIALLEWLPKGKEYLFVMPGSHTKFVTADSDGRLTGCLTSLAGEILSLLTTQSILADAVKHGFITTENYDVKEMLAGFRTARETSLSRAAFSTRIMNQFVAEHPSTCANFLLGAVLESDVAAVKRSRALNVSAAANVVVAGNDPMRSALVRVFEEDVYFEKVHAYVPSEGMMMSAYGAYLIARQRGALA